MVVAEPLWKIRLKLLVRSFKTGWELFKEKKLALFGLGVIIFFAIFGLLYPLYPMIMRNLFGKMIPLVIRPSCHTIQS